MSTVLTTQAMDAANVPLTLLKLKQWFNTTDKELSNVTGIGRRTVANKLNGVNDCSVVEALAFARAFGVDLEVLYMTPIDAIRWVLNNIESVEMRAQVRSRWLSETCRSEYVALTFDFDAYDQPSANDYDTDSRLVSCGHAA